MIDTKLFKGAADGLADFVGKLTSVFEKNPVGARYVLLLSCLVSGVVVVWLITKR